MLHCPLTSISSPPFDPFPVTLAHFCRLSRHGPSVRPLRRAYRALIRVTHHLLLYALLARLSRSSRAFLEAATGTIARISTSGTRGKGGQMSLWDCLAQLVLGTCRSPSEGLYPALRPDRRSPLRAGRGSLDPALRPDRRSHLFAGPVRAGRRPASLTRLRAYGHRPRKPRRVHTPPNDPHPARASPRSPD
jgi:hypothetical protein